jgi:hypothetical protein
MKTKILNRAKGALLVIMVLLIKPAAAQKAETEKSNKQFSITAEANYLKHYLWRGALFGNDDVSQPFVSVSYKNFTAGFGANINLRPSKLSDEFYSKKVMYDEQDFELGYSSKLGKLEFTVKAMAYIYFHQIETPSTAEGYIKLSYPLTKNITAFTETAADAASYKGAIYNSSGLLWEKSAGSVDFLVQANAAFASPVFTNVYYYTEASGLLFTGMQAAVQKNFKQCYLKLAGEHNFYLNKAIIENSGRKSTSNFSVAVGKEISL